MATSTKDIVEEEWQLLANLGVLYKELRLAAGLTQREAAKALGTSQARLPVLENGQADVMITTLRRWAQLYGHDLEIHLVPIEDEFTKALREAAEELASEEEENAT